MNELVLERNQRRGDRGRQVRRIQEWLCLHDVQVKIDGDFGPATEFAVKQFQSQAGLVEDGIVGKKTFGKLVLPMTEALKGISATSRQLGRLVVRYAQQHLRQAPREVGGENRGPWVRLYMNGNEGDDWLWCAGFACFVLRQACTTLEIEPPLTPSFSVDSLAASAKARGIFAAGTPSLDRTQIMPGSFFLSRRTDTDWFHTGIVKKADSDVLLTVEGNTNDEGSAEGYEVCQRIRGYKDKDFILI